MTRFTARVLLVEDNPKDARILRKALSNSRDTQFEIHHEETLSNARKRLRDDPFDAILLDITLPDSRAMQTVDEVIEFLPDTPVILLTGVEDRQLAHRALQKGIQDYLLKDQLDGHTVSRAIRYAMDRAQYERKLQRREKQFDQLAENVNDVFALASLDFSKLFYVSPAYESIWGRSVESLYEDPLSWMDGIHPEDRPKIEQNLNELTQGQRDLFDVEYRVRRPDGTVRWVWSKARRSETHPSGETTLASTTRDITRRKQTEQERQRVLDILEVTPDFVATIGPDGEIRYLNDSMRRRFELDPDEDVSGMTMSRFHPPDVVETIRKEGIPTAREQGLWREETILRGPDGREDIPVSQLILSHRNKRGEITHLSTVMRDISEQKKAKKALREKQDHYQSLFEDAPITKWVEDFSGVKDFLQELDESGVEDLDSYLRDRPEVLQECIDKVRLVDVNQAGVELYEAPDKQTFLRNGLPGIFSEQSRQQFVDEVMQLWNGTTHYTKETVDRTLNGNFIHVHLSISMPPGYEEDWSRLYVACVDITALKKTRQALEESERQFRELAETIPEGFWMMDVDSEEVLYINPAYERIWGEPAETFMGDVDAWLEQVHPEDRARVRRAVEQREQTGNYQDYDVEYRVRRSDGTVRWIHDRAFPIRDENGNVRRLAGLAADITERKQAESVLRQSKARYHSLFKNSPIAQYEEDLSRIKSRLDDLPRHATDNLEEYLTDRPQLLRELIEDIEITNVNDEALDLLGAGSANQLKERFPETFQEGTLEAFAAEMAALYSGRPVYEREEVLTALDGETRYVVTKTTIPPDYRDSWERVYFSFLDITDRHQYKQALEESESRFRRLAEHIEDVFWIYDQDAQDITYVSPAFREVWGRDPEGVLGSREHLIETLVESDRERFKEAVGSRATGEETDIQYRIRRPDGEVRWIRDRAFPIRDEEGTVTRMVGVAEDITEQKTLQQKISRQRNYFQKILNTAHNYIAVKREGGTYEMVNPGMARFLGGDPEEIEGRSDTEFFPPDVVEQIRQLEGEVLDYGEPVERELRMKSPSTGEVRWFLITKAPFDLNMDQAETDDKRRIMGVSTDITERKRTEQELRSSKKRLEYLLKASPAVIYSCDPGNFESATYISANVREQLGYEPEEIVNDPSFWIDHVHPEDRERIRENNPALWKQGHLTHEYRFRHADGEYRWMHDESRLIRDDDGHAKEIVGYWVDITERKKMEESLREAQHKFTQLADNLDQVFWMIDPEYEGYLYLSPAFEDIWGRDGSEMTDLPGDFLDTVHPDDRERVREGLPEQREGDYEIEYRIVRPDGSVRWIEDRVFPVENKEGDIYRLAGISEDITERVEAQKTLEESELRFRQMAENIDQVFWLSSRDKQVLYANPAFERIWGISCEEIYRDLENWFERIHPEDEERIREIIPEKQLAGDYDEEYRIVRPNGDVRWIHDRAFPIENEEGEVYRLAGVAEDITERKRITRNLRAALEEKETLLKEVHHRVRNNLQVVSSLLGLHSRQVPSNQARQALDESKNRIYSMALIHECLYESDHLSNLDLKQYLQDLVQHLVSSRDTGDLDLEVELDIESLRLDTDHMVPCGLVVNELVTNALKHAFEGQESGTIRVSFHRNGDDQYQIQIADDGIGWPHEEDFREIDSLGMKLVVRLVTRQLGGDIRMRSESGTQFVITF